MQSGWCGRLGLGNGSQTVAVSSNSDNCHPIQGDFYEFIMEVRITVLVTKKGNVEEGSRSKFWGNMVLYG